MADHNVPHILVVDDEPDVAALFRQKFRKAIRAGELEFHFAANGREALGIVENAPEITVVFTDLNMPGMDGLEFLSRVNALDGRVLRTIVVSAYGDMDNIRRAMNLGAMDFLIKPIDLEDLGATLRKATEDVEAQQAGIGAKEALERTRREKEVAELARKTQKEFFDNVTHELRTPLTLLLGPLESALDASGSEIVRAQLTRALRHGGQLLDLVDELLEVARIDAGMRELQLVRADLHEFVRSVCETFRPLARARSVHFGHAVPESGLRIDFDPKKLQKVLANLLSNAFKFTPEGGVVRLTVDPPGGGAVRIRISDSGSGIAEHDLDRVFDRFYRTSAAETGDVRGAGIGLALVRDLVELHGGQVTAASPGGKGTEFTVVLPVRREAPEGPASAAFSLPEPGGRDGEASPAGPPAGDAEIVLVVEDHPEMARHVREVLGDRFAVLTAADGAEGLDIARQQVPDIIVSDVMMPRMDGHALISALRTDPATSHIPVVLLTAGAQPEQRLEGLRSGADAWLSKPFNRAELRTVLENMLRRQREARAKYRAELHASPSESSSLSREDEFLLRVREVMGKELGNEFFGVEQMAEALGMSRKTLHRKLKALTGRSPNRFIRIFRLETAMQMLKQGSGQIGEVAYLTGFSSHSYFSKCFTGYFRMSPTEAMREE